MLRPSTSSLSTTCGRCARLVVSSRSAPPFVPLTPALPSPVQGSRYRSVSRRHHASFAQAEAEITSDATTESELSVAEPLHSLDQDHSNRTEPEHEREVDQAYDDLFTTINESTFARTQPRPSPPNPATRSPVYQEEPEPSLHEAALNSKQPAVTLESLIARPIDSAATGPTVVDLEALAPRRFNIPSVTSPDSHRTIYARVWDTTRNKVNRAFSKSQLVELISRPTDEGGLGIDVTDAQVATRLKLGTPGKKSKLWKPKRLDQMSKRELIHTILIAEWKFVHPDVVPSAHRGPSVSKAIPLSDRILFLLLSPNCPVIAKITRHLGIKVSFSRHPKTQVLSLVLKGSESTVAAARAEVESIDEIGARKEIQLPRPATSLRPEVYQTISRLAKTYLEPGSHPNTLSASAMEPKSLVRSERLLAAAFASDKIRQSTRQFVSAPTSLGTVQYSMYPFQPLSIPAALESGSTSTYARLKALSNVGTDQHELQRWSEKMRLDHKVTRIPILFDSAKNLKQSSMPTTVFEALFEPFSRQQGSEDSTTTANQQKFELRAQVGHVLFPLYKQGGSRGETVVGPILDGKFGWEKWVEWSQAKRRNESIFVPSAPQRFLDSTGVTCPLPTTHSPFASLFAPLESFSNAQGPVSPEQQTDLASHPTFASSSFRRFVYYPVEPRTLESDVAERLELVISTGRDAFGQRQSQASFTSIRETQVDVLVPTGQNDLRFNLRQTRDVQERDLEIESVVVSKGSTLLETIAENQSQSPLEITHKGIRYFLHTSSQLRQTLIEPPSSPFSSSTTTTVRQELELYNKALHEEVTVYLPEPRRFTSIEYVIHQDRTKDEIRSGTRSTFNEVGGQDDQVEVKQKWSRVLESFEKKCQISS
ncbi:uncharacterized protein JCM15063_006061 [Sporobolomyces koalae]|uniref:uncharacterized protein n=1 Tax=Sporobolomyces koalae TaxID=500713 RepID=UPI0031708C0F